MGFVGFLVHCLSSVSWNSHFLIGGSDVMIFFLVQFNWWRYACS